MRPIDIHEPSAKHNIQCQGKTQPKFSRETHAESGASQPRQQKSAGDAGEMHSQNLAPNVCAAIMLLADDTRITATQFRVLALIAKGYAKRADMAAKIGKTVVTVARAIDALVKLRLIEREPVKGKPSTLRIAGLVLSATRIIADTPDQTRIIDAPGSRIIPATSIIDDTTTRITHDASGQTRIANDTGSRIIGAATAADDTGRTVDKSRPACIEHARAPAQSLTFNTTTELNSETPELALAAVAARAPPRLNGSAKGLPSAQLAAIIVEHIASPWLDPARASGLHTSHARIRAWIGAGADFDADILPTIAEVMARPRRQPVASWGYFDRAVGEAVSRRLAAETPIASYQPAGPIHDQPSSASLADVRVRREPVSPATAARMQRRRERAARNQPLDFGRVESVAIE